ncbi:MAG: hypothetical protein EXR72_25115 [Myxococcales bacterium]|nr:hypothetical protein [Myxococcales bacterium]
MRLRALTALAWVLALGRADAAPGPDTASTESVREAPDVLFARGRQAYVRSDYDAAIRALRGVLYPTVQVSSDEEIEAHKLLALSYFFQRDVREAENEFSTLLQLDGGFSLDRVYDPPKAVAFLEDLRRRNREKLEEMAEQKRRERAEQAERRRREEEERIRLSMKPVVIERTIEKHHRFLCFVPFGVGQLQNGHPRKFYFFLTSQLALGLGSAALFTATQINYPKGTYPADQETVALSLRYTTIGLGALFWADVLIGVIDALVHYRPVVITESQPAAPPPPPRKLSLTPFVAPAAAQASRGAAAGLSFQGVF